MSEKNYCVESCVDEEDSCVNSNLILPDDKYYKGYITQADYYDCHSDLLICLIDCG